MRAVDLIVTIGWIAFWLYWLSAAVGVKAGRGQWQRSVGSRLVIAAIVIGLFHIPGFHWHETRDPLLGGIGVAVFVLGLSVAIWARIHLGRNWGSPMSEKTDPELVTTGPYRWIRNPIYSGLILAGIGTAIAVSVDSILIVVVVGGFFVYSAVSEQRFLTARFPDTYPSYKSSTKMLIPFVF